jgi:hypothetical protein
MPLDFPTRPDAPGPVRVDAHVSDLFFNHDLSGAHRTPDGSGDFDGFDDAKLHEEAAFVLRCLDKLGVSDLPNAEQLVADFYSRL